LNDPKLATEVENPVAVALSEVPGAELLVALLENARAHPNLTAAGLVEAWRERPEGRYLQKLAAQEVHLHDPDAATTELQELLGLIHRDALTRRLNDLLGRADKLAEAEKRELQALQRKLAAPARENPVAGGRPHA
jgi:DNA primase